MTNSIEKILYATNNQKVFYFLMEHIGEEFYDRQISKLAGVSRAGANFALRELEKAGLVQRENRGRMSFYRLERKNALIKEFKVVQNIVFLKPLIDKLVPLSLQMVLYGSASKGENTAGSDFDIFVLTREPKEVQKIIFDSKSGEKVKCIVNTPNEFAVLRKNNKVFYSEILNGIMLWEK